MKTVLDAIVSVLGDSTAPKSAREIHQEIALRTLFTFRTKDEVGIVRAAIRRHLRAVHAGTTSARLRQLGRDQFASTH